LIESPCLNVALPSFFSFLSGYHSCFSCAFFGFIFLGSDHSDKEGVLFPLSSKLGYEAFLDKGFK